MNEDVFPIEHVDFPASHVSFQGCIIIVFDFQDMWFERLVLDVF